MDPILGSVLVVRGELSNVKRSSRGHLYLTLKDANASIAGIIWASVATTLPFDVEEGMAVFVTGTLDVYAPSGTYSLVIKKLEPVGIGSLQLAFQQLKQRLEAEGLFRDDMKKTVPAFPERIGIITSSTGAVIHDMLRVIRRKNHLVNVLLKPTKVQGVGAAIEIATAIREMCRPEYGLDVLIVARGGGSFEDLFCFSEEPVVRAVADAPIPIVTGIGHEPDFSLADAAADYSASTPTAAAEFVVPDLKLFGQQLAHAGELLAESLMKQSVMAERQTETSGKALLDEYSRYIAGLELQLTTRQQALVTSWSHMDERLDSLMGSQATTLDAFSPLKTLQRGYAIVTATPAGKRSKKRVKPISSIQEVVVGTRLKVQVSDGQFACEVIET
jgi:exodeoxyribonuclease VII large subunit